jgi:propionaldehyde dehydrogenase
MDESSRRTGGRDQKDRGWICKSEDIAGDVGESLKRMEAEAGVDPSDSVRKPLHGDDKIVFVDVDEAVATASKAQKSFEEQGLEVRRAVIKAMRKTAISNAESWGRMAVEETKMGRAQDKAQKNMLCATRTPGVEDLQSKATTGDTGLTLVEYAPFGVVAAVTPSNNPVATIISNTIAILAAGNSVVFAPHPGAEKVCRDAMHALSSAAVLAGAPAGLITTVYPTTQAATHALLSHPGVHLNLVTGGPSIVKVAMTTGVKIRKDHRGRTRQPAGGGG